MNNHDELLKNDKLSDGVLDAINGGIHLFTIDNVPEVTIGGDRQPITKELIDSWYNSGLIDEQKYYRMLQQLTDCLRSTEQRIVAE